LIELLVVIGIILVLIGILIPAVGAMRRHQQAASTRNQMIRMSAAINSYFNDFQAYPGALPNKFFTSSSTGTPGISGTGVSATTLTQTEDCVLALIGGWRLTGLNLVFTPGDLGQGPTSFNADPTMAKRYNAYMEYRPSEFSAPQPLKDLQDLGMSYATDSAVPELMDSYSTPRPILYLRPNPGGAVGIMGDPNALAKVVYHGKASFKSDCHYDLDQVLPYANTAAAKAELKDFAGGDVTQMQPYFASGLTGKFAGAYMLIAPGSDRVYGNADDIVMGAGGGQ